MFEIHKRKLFWFTILIFRNFHFYYRPSLQTKREEKKKSLQNLNEANSRKYSNFRKFKSNRNVTRKSLKNGHIGISTSVKDSTDMTEHLINLFGEGSA